MNALERRMAAFEAESSGTSGHCANDTVASCSGEGVAFDDGDASDTSAIYACPLVPRRMCST
jgi:hypothetical protein